MSDCLLVGQTVGSCIHYDVSDIEHYPLPENVFFFKLHKVIRKAIIGNRLLLPCYNLKKLLCQLCFGTK